MRLRLLTAAALLTVTTVGCISVTPAGRDLAVPLPAPKPISLLTTSDGCEDLLERLKDSVRERVGPYGLYGYGGPGIVWSARTSGEFVQASARLDAPSAAGAPPDDVSTTNVQEAGVDEADVIETDGRRILALVGSKLVYVDIAATPERRGSLELDDSNGGRPSEMFLDGDRVLVVQGAWSHMDGPRPLPGGRGPAVDSFGVVGRGTTTVSVVDLTHPDDLVITDSFTIDGSYQTARMIDGVARIVVATEPDELAWLYPQTSEGEAAARAHNRGLVDDSTLDQWLPSIHQDGRDERATACDQVFLPRRFAGAGMVNVVTVRVADQLEPQTVSVQGSSQTVYASKDNLYVAAPSWVDPPEALEPGDDVFVDPPPTTTDVHRFSLADPDAATYDVSGRVDGSVMGQFALSEHDGFLRVATTDGPQWSWGDESVSSITVLHELEGELVRRGKVGDMGRGERITSVRFDGDRAYVVTFRQTDPFYVVDLADPARPRLAGELKLPGFSSYLHPLGDGRVLGVGQDATDEGQQTGTKVSLFDVSDPAAPKEAAQWTQPGGYSAAEADHRAFLWWPETGQVALPLSSSVPEFQGAVVLDIGTDRITETGRVSQIAVERSVVVGETLYTYSAFGLVSTDLADSQNRASIPWS